MNLYLSIQYLFYSLIGIIKGYNIYNIKKSALLSKLIYDCDDKNIDYNKGIDYNNINKLSYELLLNNNIKFNKHIFTNLNEKYHCSKSNKDIFGYFYNNKIYCIILLDHECKEINTIFRGSSYLNEWIQNFNLFETKLDFNENYKMHSGIYNMYTYENADKNIINILKYLYLNFYNYKKVFNAHSKGCINSILTAYQLTNDKDYIDQLYNKNFQIYCFGNPPVFNLELAKKICNLNNIKILNIINDFDIIPNLQYNYHIGDEIIIHDDYTLSIKKKSEPYKYDNKICLFNLFLCIQNHDLDKYMKLIFT